MNKKGRVDKRKFAQIVEALSSFRCCLDEDIETFLTQKSIDFYKHDWCSTYLLLNEQEFDNGVLRVEAYFTLSHKSIRPSIEISNTVRKRLTRGFNKAETIEFILIGHLGKRIERLEDGTIIKSDVSSCEILSRAFEIAQASNDLIPCRFVLVECSDCKKVRKVYEDFEFSFLQNDGEHNQYYKAID